MLDWWGRFAEEVSFSASRFLEESCQLVSNNEEPGTKNQEPESKIRIANIGTGRPQTVLEFAEHWWKQWGATANLQPIGHRFLH